MTRQNTHQRIAVVAHEHQRVDRTRVVGHADPITWPMFTVVRDHERYTAR